MATEPVRVFLKDYRPPPYLVERVDLDFDIGADAVTVAAALDIAANPAADAAGSALELDGAGLEPLAVRVDGRELPPSAYEAHPGGLRIPGAPPRLRLETVVRLRPAENKSLEGLYAAGPLLCTQNEPEGFRRITYYIDRPDVLATFTTTITADRERHPVLLSNGNKAGEWDLPGGRHAVRWVDPFPKPCYLFALVAGRLAAVRDTHRTRGGREVALSIYVEPGEEPRAAHAMRSLKKAMEWDEAVYGLECDLDNYMVAAVSSFNAGAMENKGLNIFNSKYVFADPESATDGDYQAIERVVAHEYFHNWTGNRVTLRDWFQLTLKEGLTVFRDQEFSADVQSRPVKRIEDVRRLRDAQFVEDAGPLAHPIRPSSYAEINNFYTATVYEKGAEVVRMVRTLLGASAFRAGMDTYIRRHDGKAATCEDFLDAMASASGRDLSQMLAWYSQAGTPEVDVVCAYDPGARVCTLTLSQSCPPTPESSSKEPFLIPFAVGLVGAEAGDLPLEPAAGPVERIEGTTAILALSKPVETVVFANVPERPAPSLLRGFSAPVRARHAYTPADLLLLLRRDGDSFNRFESGQRLLTLAMRRVLDAKAGGALAAVEPELLDAFGALAADDSQCPAFRARALAWPSIEALADEFGSSDFHGLADAAAFVAASIALRNMPALTSLYHALADAGPYSPDPLPAGRRALRNTCLEYLCELGGEFLELAWLQFRSAANMTDALAALRLLCAHDAPRKAEALDMFRQRWQADKLVMTKWMAAQAGARRGDTLAAVRAVAASPLFDIQEPNDVHALLGSLASNPVHFHRTDGASYAFLADMAIQIDAFNPSVSARLAKSFKRYPKMDGARQALMRVQLERMASRPGGASRGLAEVVQSIMEGR